MVSLLELMLACLISYQVLPPTNLRVCAKRRFACPVEFSTKNHPYTLLWDCMPPPTITDASGIWIRMFDYLQSIHCLAPCDRITSTALKFWGYTNVVPSLRVRPTLYLTFSNPPLFPGSGHSISLCIFLVVPRDSFHLRLDPTLIDSVQRCPHAITLGASKTSRTCFKLLGYI